MRDIEQDTENDLQFQFVAHTLGHVVYCSGDQRAKCVEVMKMGKEITVSARVSL